MFYMCIVYARGVFGSVSADEVIMDSKMGMHGNDIGSVMS